ncbi:MAG: hypothetical protein KGQ59_04995 [Bdellovibrionales bacterium]|nr:hypothetical protein [Bdellovibrionales bacterium]
MSQIPLFLRSEDELLAYFKRFLKDKPKAVQLSGATKVVRGAGVIAVFRFTLDDRRYKLLGDVTREAIEEFVAISEEHGSPSMALKHFEKEGTRTLILSTHHKPDGWHCLPFAEKAKEQLSEAA